MASVSGLGSRAVVRAKVSGLGFRCLGIWVVWVIRFYDLGFRDADFG